MGKYVLNKPVIKRSIPILLILAFVTSLSASLLIVPIKGTDALSGSQFSAGRIIDDVVFFDRNSMSVSQIQSFLNSKVPTCDTNHAKSSSSNDSGPPYTCLKDYRQNTTNIAPESGLCNGYTGASNESAATIIYKVSQSCGISPKVLLVMLQKEQSLVTDTWPWDIQYEKAMGAFCPDTAPCNPQYAGFFYQVYYGAHRFKVYKANPDSFSYKAGRNNTIYRHPGPFNGSTGKYYGSACYVGDQIRYDSACSSSSRGNAPDIRYCGSSSVFIQNVATALLYIYTPYQPNQAALDNLYTTGDTCSSYGNRNFWRLFNDWFGPTHGTPFFEINNRIYIHGADNTYYYVTSPQALRDYGYGTTVKSVTKVDTSYVNGMTNAGSLPLIARFEGVNVYAINDAKRYYFSSPTLFNSYGFVFGDEAKLPSWVEQYITNGSTMQSILRSGNTAYSIENGKARQFCSGSDFATLGSPIYSTRPYVVMTASFPATLAPGAPIASAGTVIKSTDASYGVWDGSSLQEFSSSAATDLGPSVCSTSNSGFSQLPTGSDPIDKLVKSSAGDMFILDRGGSKLSVSPSNLSGLGYVSNDFITTNDVFLSRLSTRAMGKLIRIKNDINVFLIESGTKHRVYSRSDLYGLGFDFDQVQTVSGPTAELFETGGPVLSQGRLVRIGSESAVYLIGNNFEKFYIPDRSIMSDYGYSFGSVISVSGGTLGEYPTAGSLVNIMKDGSNNFWLISLGQKHKISSTLLSTSNFSIDQGATKVLSTKVLGEIPIGKDLTRVFRADNNAKVYIIDNGQKRYVTSPTALANSGYTFADVVSLSPSYVSSLPDGPPYN